jgi:hypothetical protein
MASFLQKGLNLHLRLDQLNHHPVCEGEEHHLGLKRMDGISVKVKSFMKEYLAMVNL